MIKAVQPYPFTFYNRFTEVLQHLKRIGKKYECQSTDRVKFVEEISPRQPSHERHIAPKLCKCQQTSCSLHCCCSHNGGPGSVHILSSTAVCSIHGVQGFAIHAHTTCHG